MRNLILLAVLAMASPAWGQTWGSPALPGVTNHSPIVAAEDDVCAKPGICGSQTIPHGYGVTDSAPAAIVARQYCSPGYALLAYPGTWTLVCAKDLMEPR